MRSNFVAWAVALACPFRLAVRAQTTDTKTRGIVTITGGPSSSLPTQIPPALEGITRSAVPAAGQPRYDLKSPAAALARLPRAVGTPIEFPCHFLVIPFFNRRKP